MQNIWKANNVIKYIQSLLGLHYDSYSLAEFCTSNDGDGFLKIICSADEE